MAYLRIPNVTVGKWKPGTIFGDCMIFSFNMKFGMGESKTTCSMSIINENGVYPQDLTKIDQRREEVPLLSFVNHYDIQIGSSGSAVVVRMYLVSAQETYGPEGKYFQLNFVDGSHILDRTFIGLLHRHDGYNRPINVGHLKTGFDVPIICPPCDPAKSAFKFKVIKPTDPLYGDYVQREIDYSKQIPIGNNKIGGVVIVGTEQFTTSDCDLKDVDYNFTELVNALKTFGISVFIRDRKPEYRATHVGTLREVLSAWCADFGVTWSYDSLNVMPTVIETGANTAKAANQIQTINTVARSINSKSSQSLVESIDYNVSIEETYRQYLVSAYKKPSEPQQYEKTTFYRTYLENIGVEEIFVDVDNAAADPNLPAGGFLDGRTYEQFKISCCFARFSPELRTLYLLHQGSYAPLGFTPVQKIGNAMKKQIIDFCLNTDSYLDILDYIAGSGASLKDIKDADFDMFLGSYDKNMEDAYIDWEKKTASTFGKYFMSSLLPTDRTLCPENVNFKFQLESSMIPDAKFFYKKHEEKEKKKKCQPATQILSPQSTKELASAKFNSTKYVLTNNVPGGLPFNDILRGPMGKDIFTVAPPNKVKGGGGALKYSEFVRIFERSGATWNVDEVDWECQLTNPVTNESLVEKYMPRYQPVEGLIKTRLLTVFAGNKTIREAIEGARGQIPTLMIIPKKKRLGKLLKVSGLESKPNELEVENTITQRSITKTEEKDCDKTALCEKQADLTSAACECDDGGKPPPTDKKSGVLYDSKQTAYIDGLVNNLSEGFSWTFSPDPIERSELKGGKLAKFYDHFEGSLDVVFPCGVSKKVNNEFYQGNFVENVKRTTWSNKIQEIRNDFMSYPVGNVSAIRVVPNEATQNMDSFPTNVTGGSVAKIFLPPSNFQGLGKMLDLNAYHLLMNTLNDLGTHYPKVSLTVNLGSLNFGELFPYMKTQFGLQDFNVKIDESGGSATISWTSGLAKKPKHDLIMTQVMPRAKYSMYVR